MKQNWIRFKPLSFNWWRLEQRIFYHIIKRRIKFLDDFFSKRSACYSETLRDFYNPYPPFYDGPIGEREILKEQIQHLDGIIEVLEDCKKRELDLKDVRRERGWLKDNLGSLEKVRGGDFE